MSRMSQRRACYFGIGVIMSSHMLFHVGRVDPDQVSPRLRLDDAFEKVAPLLDSKQYDAAAAALRGIAVSRTHDGASGGIRTDGWTGIKGGPEKVDIQ